jgi:hypothetical protein
MSRTLPGPDFAGVTARHAEAGLIRRRQTAGYGLGVPFEAALRALYPQAMPAADFADLATERLAPFGFAPGNFLPLIGMCRDELMFDVEHELQRRWGSGFDMSSLAAMVLLGRSGIEAATHHAPDDSGLRRYVIVLLPHIGIDADGSVGAVRRDGQLAPRRRAERWPRSTASC